MKLDGRAAIVTDASRGLGAATVRQQFVAEGADVLRVARDPQRFQLMPLDHAERCSGHWPAHRAEDHQLRRIEPTDRGWTGG
jgi:NAD(P)-dependent dehydrogenase (short-subunit alcohol dehydrogenase family)